MTQELMFLCLLITRMQELLGHRQQFGGSGSGLRFSVQKKDGPSRLFLKDKVLNLVW